MGKINDFILFLRPRVGLKISRSLSMAGGVMLSGFAVVALV
ncbi:hypothetical protein M595_0455 [Lyngbya aestuarii BL J]|uniref:Uncharacterized protein n=1 Tax=Lyngbya aestuarii BL J TaxID=1348334 RepID=U7QQP1_9CYAN|nr:hypothetical protein M595_0455 [Lyngbya aestuarii BL J]